MSAPDFPAPPETTLAPFFELLCRTGAVKILGDSIAAGFGTSKSFETDEPLLALPDCVYYRWEAPNGWAARFSAAVAERGLLCYIDNCGCPGISSGELLTGLEGFLSGKPEAVLLLVGANDRKLSDGRAALAANLRALLARLRAGGCAVAVLTPPPCTPENDALPSRLFHLPEVCELLRAAAKEAQLPLIDHHALISRRLAAEGRDIHRLMREPGCLSDGLHPTDRVCAWMCENMLDALGLSPQAEYLEEGY